MLSVDFNLKNFEIIEKLSSQKHWDDKIMETNIKITNVLVEDVKTVISTGVRTGRAYPAGVKRGRRYSAGRHSAENEPIKSMTGETVEKTYGRSTANEIDFGSTAPYSGDPEYGIGMVARRTYQKEFEKKRTLLVTNLEQNIVSP
jgi:hypothetical protein